MIKTRYSTTTQKVLEYKKATYNESRMTAQNPLGNTGRLPDQFFHLLLRHTQRDQSDISSSRGTLRPILALLV